MIQRDVLLVTTASALLKVFFQKVKTISWIDMATSLGPSENVSSMPSLSNLC